MKKSYIPNKFLRSMSNIALSTATFVVFGSICRTWLYQPPTPAKLLDIDK